MQDTLQNFQQLRNNIKNSPDYLKSFECIISDGVKRRSETEDSRDELNESNP